MQPLRVERADVRDTHKLVVSHIQRIRSIPEFEDAVAVLVLESNLACVHLPRTDPCDNGMPLSNGVRVCEPGLRRST